MRGQSARLTTRRQSARQIICSGITAEWLPLPSFTIADKGIQRHAAHGEGPFRNGRDEVLPRGDRPCPERCASKQQGAAQREAWVFCPMQ